MVDRDELLEWVKSLPPNSDVFIDEGGLNLVCLQDTKLYIEVGGEPDDDDL